MNRTSLLQINNGLFDGYPILTVTGDLDQLSFIIDKVLAEYIGIQFTYSYTATEVEFYQLLKVQATTTAIHLLSYVVSRLAWARGCIASEIANGPTSAKELSLRLRMRSRLAQCILVDDNTKEIEKLMAELQI